MWWSRQLEAQQHVSRKDMSSLQQWSRYMDRFPAVCGQAAQPVLKERVGCDISLSPRQLFLPPSLKQFIIWALVRHHSA